MPAARVGDLVDVDDAGDGGVAVSREERDFINALADEQSPRRDRVTERVHRRHGTGSTSAGFRLRSYCGGRRCRPGVSMTETFGTFRHSALRNGIADVVALDAGMSFIASFRNSSGAHAD